MMSEEYNSEFYEFMSGSAEDSAAVVAPIIFDLLKPHSVLDVGCGAGAWLSCFKGLGVSHVRGVDGEFVDREALRIPSECFDCVDLSKPFLMPTGFDLAISLEVAEHLPTKIGPLLVQQLTEAAPVVVFSAAVPGQGGTAHINEQWHAYWHRLFAHHGFEVIDCIRPRVLSDRRVSWWYRQNIFLYVSKTAEAGGRLLGELSCGADEITAIASHILSQSTSVRGLSRLLAQAIVRAVKNRMLGQAR